MRHRAAPAWILRLVVVLSSLAVMTSAVAGPQQTQDVATRADMYATVLDDGMSRIQVLEWICRHPTDLRECHQVRDGLRAAISAAVDRPIRWVSERRRRAGDFWVLGPVRFEPGTARLMAAWWEPGAMGCWGWERARFIWTSGQWDATGGGGAAGCPAVPAIA